MEIEVRNNEMTDLELVARALSGDGESYGVLFDRYRAPVRAMLRCRTASQCDDILQETFIKAYLNLDKYNPLYTFPGWLFTIARNLYIDHSRKASVKDVVFAVDPLYAPIVSLDANPEEQAIQNQNRRNLDEALEKLSPSYREVLYLRFWCDLSYEAISDKLSMPLGTVKTQIHRARQALITLL